MDENIKKQHLDVLQNAKNDLVKRLRAAVKLELDYWSEKKDPPNLTEAEFKIVLNNIPGDYTFKYDVRKSEAGKHGRTGEQSVFYIEFKLPVRRNYVFYMIKGYFFDESDLKGVCIQSFRVTRKISRTRLTIV